MGITPPERERLDPPPPVMSSVTSSPPSVALVKLSSLWKASVPVSLAPSPVPMLSIIIQGAP